MIGRMQTPDLPTPDYAELHAELLRIAHRELARHRAGTLETRALVNEAWLKLYGDHAPQFANGQHLLCVAAQAMRQIIVDHARARLAERRGGGAQAVSLQVLETGRFAVEDSAFDIVRIHAALERLATLDERLVRVAELRLFAGLEVAEVATTLGVSEPTVKRDTRAALAFLQAELGQGPG